MIITGGSLLESSEALQLARQLGPGFYATVGCHPTRSGSFDTFEGGPDAYLERLDATIEENLKGNGRAVAVGECGLDYDRLHFASAEVQKKYFRVQLGLAKKWNLPLFLHSRAAHQDFVMILRDEGFGIDGGKAVGGRGGVVHSFTGLPEEAAELTAMGFHIGINGCSLKTQENLDTARSIPLERLMLETDGPWCSMNNTHASKAHLNTLPAVLQGAFLSSSIKPERWAQGKAVKGRNEPAAIGGVAWVLHRLLNVPFDALVETTWKNTVEMFSLTELEQFEVPSDDAK